MLSSVNRASLLVAGMLLALTGCVDSPLAFQAAAAEDPLALSFDELARQSVVSGDFTRAEAFTYAAIAARSGISPGRLDLRINNTNEAYEAFVSAISWQVPATSTVRIPAHRSITAWRRTPDGVTRIVTLTTPTDSGLILNPLSLSPTGPPAAAFVGASGLYQETTSLTSLGSNVSNAPVADNFWVATSGYVKIRESVSGASCPKPNAANALAGVNCQQARFVVRMDVTMQPLSKRPYDIKTGDAKRITWPADQTLVGYKMVFTCPTVNSRSGCG